MHTRFVLAILLVVLAGLAGCNNTEILLPDTGTNGGDTDTSDDPGADTDSGEVLTPVCECGTSPGPVQAPVHLMTLAGQTSWFASPLVYDLDGDGANELIAAYYAIYVFDSSGNLLDRADDGEGRVYAPHVVADLDGDGITEIVAGNGKHVWAWEWRAGALTVKPGWPADTTTAGESPG